jgi:hypothetical protein
MIGTRQSHGASGGNIEGNHQKNKIVNGEIFRQITANKIELKEYYK